MSINKFEKYILDTIGHERGRKWLLKIEALIHKYQNYRIRQELEAKRDAAVLMFPESHRSMAKTLLDNQITSLIGPAWTATPPSTEQMHIVFDSAVKAIDVYVVLSRIVGVQPLSGPVGETYLLQYVDKGEGVALCINTIPTTASTTRLNALMPLEVIGEDTKFYGLDIKNEYAKALGSEFGSEIVTNTIRHLVSIAEETIIDYTPSKDSDIATLAYIELNKASSDIAHKTRRGRGNFIIMNPVTFSGMSLSPAMKWEPSTENSAEFSTLTYAGKWEDTYEVYFNLDLPIGKVLVGYSGTALSSVSPINTDVGITLTPYIPVIATGVMVNPDTYEPEIRFITRSGVVLNDLENEKFPQKAANYYKMVDISRLLAH